MSLFNQHPKACKPALDCNTLIEKASQIQTKVDKIKKKSLGFS